jgi:hypothetical protein
MSQGKPMRHHIGVPVRNCAALGEGGKVVLKPRMNSLAEGCEGLVRRQSQAGVQRGLQSQRGSRIRHQDQPDRCLWVDVGRVRRWPPHAASIRNPYRTQNIIQHSSTQHNTTPHHTTQHNTTQHNTTQHNTTQHNTTQHNTTQHKPIDAG